MRVLDHVGIVIVVDELKLSDRKVDDQCDHTEKQNQEPSPGCWYRNRTRSRDRFLGFQVRTARTRSHFCTASLQSISAGRRCLPTCGPEGFCSPHTPETAST